MSRSLNEIAIIGNLGADPEIRTVGDRKVANFSVATSEKWATGERTDWHRVAVWGKLADVVEQYVKKGDRLYCKGRMEYGTYEKDGVTHHTATINVRDMIMLGGNDRPRNGGGPEERSPTPSDPGDLTQPNDGLPF